MKVRRINRKVKDRLIIEFKGKKYCFSLLSLIIFPIGTIIFAILVIKFFGMRENFWYHEIITKHSVFLINILFKVSVNASYSPENYFPWSIDFPGNRGTFINTGCTYIISMSIYAAMIIFTPNSKDPKTNEDIIWRKTKSILFSLTLIYVFNIFRIALQNYLYYLGNPWSIIHDSTLTYLIIVMIHIFVFLFCNRKIPELFVSVYYSGKLLYITLKEKREKAIKIRFIKKDF
jgi:exosortase/archaeosortase family protein